MPTLKQNEIFANRYQLIKKLGVGGYSEVWLAKDNKTAGMEVALKIYSPEKGLDDKGLETFSKEFSLVFNLNHLNLLKPTYFDDYDGSPYLVMPYCKNASMADKIGNITKKELASFIHQAASALAYLHEQQPPIIHQDIKPDNFLIDNSGHFLLADFGISSKIRKTLTKTMGEKNSSGTMAYMPPEKFSRDRQTIKAGDIFSLGITLYELLTGELAFGEHGGLSLHGGADIPDLPTKFSSELNELVRSCMAKDPWDRPTADTLMEIARNYELTGKWDITKLPIVIQEVPEKPVIKPKEAEKLEEKETKYIPIIETKIEPELPESKIKNKKILIISIVLIIMIFIVVLSFFSFDNEKLTNKVKIKGNSTLQENKTVSKIQSKNETDQPTEKINNDVITNDNWQANYDKVYAFFFERAVVMKNGKYGYVDTNGKLVIPLQYQDAYDFRKEGLALVKKNKLFGFIDKNGKIKINFHYKKAKSFENGKAYVYGVDWHYIDTKGYIITNQAIIFNSNPKEPIKILKIGDTYAGGIIFYLDETGKHGKVCDNYDYNQRLDWSNAYIYIEGSGWYLPTKDELKLIYKNLKMKNLGSFKSSFYWSSTESIDSNNAWFSDFSDGSLSTMTKTNTAFVRGVREF
jgi:serine/threonine protein kinase